MAIDALCHKGSSGGQSRVAEVLLAQDWELLCEIIDVVREDADVSMAMTDPYRFRKIREAITRYHIMGYTGMSRETIRQALEKAEKTGKMPEVKLPLVPF